MGELGRGFESVDRRICVGISGSASRFVGLRRRVAADAVYMERQDAGDCDHHEDGAGVRSESPEWQSRFFRCKKFPWPKSDIPGEEAWPTQPSGISTIPEGLKVSDAWGLSAEERKWCEDRIAASRSEGIFTPPSLQGTIVYPGNAGGVNWSSSAFDPRRHLLIMKHQSPGHVGEVDRTRQACGRI